MCSLDNSSIFNKQLTKLHHKFRRPAIKIDEIVQTLFDTKIYFTIYGSVLGKVPSDSHV